MSQKGSVFQKGGGGTNFEQLVQTAFLTTLIIHGNAPCLDSGELSEVALQVTNRGYETDDFMVTAKSASGEHRILIQVKHDMRPLQNSYPKICSLHYFFVPLWYETNSFFSQFCRCRSRSA